MRIVVIDGQGGGLGKQIVAAVKERFKEVEVIAIGTNANATAAMHKAGADASATGENPIVVNCREADIIIGPIGIVITDSMLGEVTAKMALAVSQAKAIRLLIPVNICNNFVIGVPDLSISVMIDSMLRKLSGILANKSK